MYRCSYKQNDCLVGKFHSRRGTTFPCTFFSELKPLKKTRPLLRTGINANYSINMDLYRLRSYRRDIDLVHTDFICSRDKSYWFLPSNDLLSWSIRISRKSHSLSRQIDCVYVSRMILMRPEILICLSTTSQLKITQNLLIEKLFVSSTCKNTK